jgi:hypothetical protein
VRMRAAITGYSDDPIDLAREGSAVHVEWQDVSPAEAGWKSIRTWRDADLKVRSTRTPEEVLHPKLPLIAVLFCLFLLSSLASAQKITGTVTNGTTGKPAAGDEVTLLSLSQGMQEIGSTKADAQGRFSFPAPTDTQAPHMVRVTHQGVSYVPQGGPLMPGSTTAELTVYDSAKKIDGLSQTVEVDRFQSDGKQLQGIALYAVTNKSQPPRTLANDKGSFEIALPDGAEVDSAEAKGPGRCAPAKRSSRSPTTCPTAAKPASHPSRCRRCSTLLS